MSLFLSISFSLSLPLTLRLWRKWSFEKNIFCIDCFKHRSEIVRALINWFSLCQLSHTHWAFVKWLGLQVSGLVIFIYLCFISVCVGCLFIGARRLSSLNFFYAFFPVKAHVVEFANGLRSLSCLLDNTKIAEKVALCPSQLCKCR